MLPYDTKTLLLLHEDRVKELQKMHEPLPFLSNLRWPFWRKSKPQQESASSKGALRERREI